MKTNRHLKPLFCLIIAGMVMAGCKQQAAKKATHDPWLDTVKMMTEASINNRIIDSLQISSLEKANLYYQTNNEAYRIEANKDVVKRNLLVDSNKKLIDRITK